MPLVNSSSGHYTLSLLDFGPDGFDLSGVKRLDTPELTIFETPVEDAEPEMLLTTEMAPGGMPDA